MNKRIRKKIEGKNNSIKIDTILKEITNEFTLKDKVLGSSYFIFNKGENSVCHFTLKETPNWKYGLWLKENNDNGNDGYYIFGEHIEFIDKFKPGRCYIDFEDDTKEFISSVKDISLKPKYHFVNSLTYGNAEVDYKEIIDEDGTVFYEGYQVVRSYNEKTHYYDIITRDKSLTQESYIEKEYNKYFQEKAAREADEEYDRKLVFDFFKTTLLNLDDIVSVGVIDNNVGGFRCNPRYDVLVVIKKDLTDDAIEKICDRIEVLENNIDSNKKTCEHSFRIGGLYDDIKDILKCQYKYYKKL